jgi:hypothetical protein
VANAAVWQCGNNVNCDSVTVWQCGSMAIVTVWECGSMAIVAVWRCVSWGKTHECGSNDNQ